MRMIILIMITVFVLPVCAETSQSAYGTENNPRSELSFTKDELDKAYKELVPIIGDDLKAVASGKKKKKDVAGVATSLSRNPRYSKAVRFLLAKGAFGLYIDAGEFESAKNLLIFMDVNDHYSLTMLLKMMKENQIDFGIKCADSDCPLLLSSLQHLGCMQNNRFGCDKERIDIRKLKLGDTALATGSRADNYHFGHNPIRIWEQGRISVNRKDVGLINPIGAITTAELYFTKRSGRLYKVVFAASYGSEIKREKACEDLKKVEELLGHWGVEMFSDGIRPNIDIDEQVDAHHFDALAKYKRNGFRDGGMMLTICSLSDCGVGDIRVDGDVSEDMHHCKCLRICICDERLESVAWKECGMDPMCSKPLCGGGNTYSNAVGYLASMCQFNKKYLGRIGWGFEQGAYGIPTNVQNAVSFYRYAAKQGNNAALSKLATLGIPKNLTSEDIRRVKSIVPQAQGYGFSPMDDTNPFDISGKKSVAKTNSAVTTHGLQDRRDRAMGLVYRSRKLGLDILKLTKSGTISTNGWGQLESLEWVRRATEDLYIIMTNSNLSAVLSKDKISEGIKKARMGMSDAGVMLQRSRIRLCTKINGEKVNGAIVEVADCRFETPVIIGGFEKGSKFGPYKITYKDRGKKYSTKFQSIDITWDGLKTFNCPLQEAR